jgi:sulfur-oxidizing protein SoxY
VIQKIDRRTSMNLTRRQALSLSAGVAAFAVAGVSATAAFADPEAANKFLMEFTGGKTPKSGKVTLTTPEIAENGNTVPVSISVDSPMTEKSYVQSVLLLADQNPRSPRVAMFNFTPMSGVATATTRIRLAKTQNVTAVAKMNDGTVYMDKKQIKVTIGGCGG